MGHGLAALDEYDSGYGTPVGSGSQTALQYLRHEPWQVRQVAGRDR